MDLKNLTTPLNYKWRVQSQNDKGAQCVAYIDSRQVAERLDEVVGPTNWQSDYRVIKDNLYAGISIWDEKINQWVWKWDVGTESNTEAEKGEASDAFKRAAVKWGIGRFLYDLDLQRVKVTSHNGKNYPCDNNGNILWSGDDLTDFINKRTQGKAADTTRSERYQTPTEPPVYGTQSYSEATIKRVGALSKNDKKGKECLKAMLEDYNKAKGTAYKSIGELDTDKKLSEVLAWIENTPPTAVL